MKAKPKSDLKMGQEANENGHDDIVVPDMLDRGIMNFEPYRNVYGEEISGWYVEISDWGYTWHISWLDVIEE